MDISLYLIFSFIDSLAALILMFKIFRIPLREYTKEVLLIGTVISVVSYFDRSVLATPIIDPFVQLLIYIFSLRLIIKIRLRDSLLIAVSGYLAFMDIQMITYPLLLSLGIVTLNDAQELTGTGTYIIQITTEAVCFLISFIIYRFNYGFSFISSPPHDLFYKKKKTSTDKIITVFTLIGSLSLVMALYWILNAQSFLYIVIPNLTLSLAILVYFLNKRDYAQ